MMRWRLWARALLNAHANTYALSDAEHDEGRRAAAQVVALWPDAPLPGRHIEAFQTLRGARIATEGHCWRPRSRGHALDEASSADLSRIDRRYRAHGNDAAQGTLPQTERFMPKALGAADSPTRGFESVRVARGTTVSVDQDKRGSTSTT